MKPRNLTALSGFAAALLFSAASIAGGQTQNESTIANVVGGGPGIRWEVSAPNAGGTLTITFPDGRAVRKSIRGGNSAQITLGEKYFENLPDGTYVYELQLAPAISGAQKEALLKGRGKDDDPENERAARKRSTISPMTQSGSFAVINGTIILPGAVEPPQKPATKTSRVYQPTLMSPFRRLLNHRASFLPDVVTADDEIIQGSLCVGLDCVNNENFGFDTIRVKENNDRIQFDDTSTSAGFPTTNWQIRANSSSSGGESFLGVVDQGSTGNSETGTVVFQVTAGAPANSLRVASNGKIGLRTATPVLDVHMNTSDTPAIRFEQNNTSGFTAQTWDVAGNEANFFVRDVTNGSRLPFRIRPGAPTSSIDISAAGNVGIGLAAPIHKMDVAGNMTIGPGFNGSVTVPANGLIVEGGVGIATASPTATLSVNGTANKPGGGSWDVFSDERLKNIKGRFTTGLKAVMQLQPIRYEYKPDNALSLKSTRESIGFGAQHLQKVIPEAVSTNQNGFLMVNNDPILWTMLNAIKEQQQEIKDLKAEVQKLKAKSRLRRR